MSANVEIAQPVPSNGGESSSLSSKEIIFAGISGVPPRYIESGLDKGTGWVEYETLEVRKGMKEDGFKFKVEYMSSSTNCPRISCRQSDLHFPCFLE